MAQVVPDTIEKTPTADSSVNKPASGTYGEKAELNRLRAALPQTQGGPGGPPAPGGAPGPSGGVSPMPGDPGRPSGSTMPPGVPDVLGHPTERPGVPIGQPLAQGGESPVTQAESARDARRALLMALSQSPQVSDTTREWAQMILESVYAD